MAKHSVLDTQRNNVILLAELYCLEQNMKFVESAMENYHAYTLLVGEKLGLEQPILATFQELKLVELITAERFNKDELIKFLDNVFHISHYQDSNNQTVIH